MGVSNSRLPSVEVVKKRFSESDLALLERGFDRLCKASPRGGLYSLDYLTFKTLLLADFPDFPESLSKRLFLVSDSNNNQFLEFPELCSLLCVLSRGTLEEKLRLLATLYSSSCPSDASLDHQSLGNNSSGLFGYSSNLGFNGLTLTRIGVSNMARLLDDDRCSLEEQFSSEAMIEELFKCLGRNEVDLGSVTPAVVQDVARVIMRHSNAPLVSWVSSVGQRLVEPLFSTSSHNTATESADQSPPKIRFKEPCKAEMQDCEHHEKRMTFRRQSSRSQIREGAEFRQRHVSPTRDAFVPGDRWFVVSVSWFDQWKAYTGCFLGEDIVKLERMERPGPIDNRELLKTKAFANLPLGDLEDDQEEARGLNEERFYPLRPDVHFGYDFVLLNESAWDFLFSIYGGGPELARDVISTENGQCELELYPVVLNVRCVALSSDDETDLGFLLQANRSNSSSSSSSACSSETGSLSSSTDMDSDESQQIVVSRQTTMKELQKRIIIACIGDSVLRSRSRSESGHSAYTDSSELSELEKWQNEYFSQDRMRLWCVLGEPEGPEDEDDNDPTCSVRSVASSSSSRSRAVSVHLLKSLEQSVEDANLEDGQTIVLELGSADGCWPLANVTTLKSIQPREACSLTVNTAQEYDPKKRVLLLGGGRSPMRKRVPGPSATSEALAASRRMHRTASSRLVDSSSMIEQRNARDGNGSPASSELRVVRKSTVPATLGLANLGNTCFMNAALQCLIHTEQFKEYFLDGSYICDVNTTSRLSSKGVLADAFAELIRTVWVGDGAPNPPFIAPRRFKKAIAQWDGRFSGYEQQDASELLSSLLDGLSEDLNRIKTKAYIELKDSDGRADDVVAREWWENHLLRELNIVTALFTGQFKSLLECSHCNYQSARFEPYMYLSLPLPDSPLRTVTINLVFCDTVRPPLVCSVRVPKDGVFKDVKEALLDLCPGETGETTNTMNKIEDRPAVELEAGRLVLAFVYERRIQSIIQDDLALDNLRERDPLFAFQLPKIDYTASGPHNACNDEVASGKMLEDHESPPVSRLQVGSVVSYQPPKTSSFEAVVVGERRGGNKVEIRFRVGSTGVGPDARRHYRTITVKKSSVEVVEHVPVLLKAEQRQWHHHSCYFLNPHRVTTVGQPFLLLLHPDKVTGEALYRLVADQLGIDLANMHEGTLPRSPVTDEEIRKAYGFKLTRVTKAGGSCGRCPWYKTCTGCPIVPNNELLTLHDFDSGSSIAVDWGMATSIKDQSFALGMAVADTHSSVEDARREECKEMPLSSLIESFSKVEELSGMDQVHCSKCKESRDHTKNIQLWRAPPVLVIHLKRFQHSSWRRKKLVNLVSFPMEDLDLSPYLAKSMPATSNKGKEAERYNETPESPSQSKSSGNDNNKASTKKKPKTAREKRLEEERDRILQEQREQVADLMDADYIGLRSYGGDKHGDISAMYDLYGVVYHSGNLGAGHYVASVKNSVDNQWYLFDDKLVSKMDESKVVNSNAYLLFYMRKDVQATSVSELFPCTKVDPGELRQKRRDLNLVPSAVSSASERCSIM